MDGKKIPKHLECPIDTFILDEIVIPLNPVFKTLGATPNILTGVSGIFGLLSVYSVYKSNYALGALLFLLSYVFDCFDGNFARTYNMVTPFGDWFDHIKDQTVNALLLLALLFKTDLTMNTKVWFVFVFMMLALLMCSYLNFQERHYHENNKVPAEHKSETLGFLSFLYTPEEKEHTNFFRFFGCGTLHLVVVFFLLYFHVIKKNV